MHACLHHSSSPVEGRIPCRGVEERRFIGSWASAPVLDFADRAGGQLQSVYTPLGLDQISQTDGFSTSNGLPCRQSLIDSLPTRSHQLQGFPIRTASQPEPLQRAVRLGPGASPDRRSVSVHHAFPLPHQHADYAIEERMLPVGLANRAIGVLNYLYFGPHSLLRMS